MKKFVGIGAIVASASVSHAALVSYSFDISGLGSDGDFVLGAPTLTHDFGGMGTVVGVDWDVNFTAHDPSWMSDPQIAIDTTDDISFDGDIDPFIFGAPNEPGFFAYSGSMLTDSFSSDGMVFLSLYEFFDDDIAPDATYGADSIVTVTYDLVPAPGAAALIGFAGLAGLRRRR